MRLSANIAHLFTSVRRRHSRPGYFFGESVKERNANRSFRPQVHFGPLEPRTMPSFMTPTIVSGNVRASAQATRSPGAISFDLNSSGSMNLPTVSAASVNATTPVSPAIAGRLATQYANNLTLEDVDKIAAFGFSAIRFVFLPRERGWSYYDSIINRIWEKGMTPILIPFTAQPMSDAQERQSLVDVAAEGASRFSNGPVLWDIWNEPTNTRFWRPAVTPSSFADFATSMIDAIKSNAPAHQVMVPSIPRLDDQNKKFLFSIFDQNPALIRKIDYLAVHLYTPTSSSTPENMMKKLDSLRKEFSSRYKCDVPFVISEMGWHTVGGGSVQRSKAAQYNVRMFLSAISYDVPLVVHYEWRDSPEEVGVSEPGIQSIKYLARPAYTKLRQMAQELDGYSFVKVLNRGDDNALLFQDASGNAKIAAWNTTCITSTLKLASPSGKTLKITDVSGQPRFVKVDDSYGFIK